MGDFKPIQSKALTAEVQMFLMKEREHIHEYLKLEE